MNVLQYPGFASILATGIIRLLHMHILELRVSNFQNKFT